MSKMKDLLTTIEELIYNGYSVDEVVAFTGAPYDWVLSEYERQLGPVEVGS